MKKEQIVKKLIDEILFVPGAEIRHVYCGSDYITAIFTIDNLEITAVIPLDNPKDYSVFYPYAPEVFEHWGGEHSFWCLVEGMLDEVAYQEQEG